MNVGKRNTQIDGLRAVMCVIIVLYHLVFRYQQLYGNPENYNFALIQYWGRFGVAVFFLISAYLMCSENLLDKGLFAFYKKKILRLWPVYSISVTVTFAALLFFPLPGRVVDFKCYLTNVLFINGFIGVPYVDGAHWYITTLISFIFAFGIINFLRIQDSFITYFAWIGCSLICSYTGLRPLLRLIGGNYVSLAVAGVMIRRIIDSKKKENIIFLALALICSLPQGLDSFIINSLACILFYLVASEKIKPFSSRFLVYLGGLSYPVYLIHQNIGMVLEYRLTIHLGQFHWSYIVAAFLFVFLLGWLLARIDSIVQRRIVFRFLK